MQLNHPVQTWGKRLRRNWSLVASVLGLLGLLYGCPLTREPLRNDWLLWRFRSAFAEMPHPAETTEIGLGSDVGLLMGNGNHCDFFVGVARCFNGDRGSIRRFYKKAVVRNPIDGNAEPVQLAFFTGGSLPGESVPYDFSRIESWGRRADKSSTVYVVYVFPSGYEPGWDFRCH